MLDVEHKSFASLKKIASFITNPAAFFDLEGNLLWYNQEFEIIFDGHAYELDRRGLIELLLKIGADDDSLDKIGRIISADSNGSADKNIKLRLSSRVGNAEITFIDNSDFDQNQLLLLTLDSKTTKNRKSESISLQKFIDLYPSGSITITDTELNIITLGGTGFEIHGFDKENFIGKPLASLLIESTLKPINENQKNLIQGKSFEEKVYFNSSVFWVTGHPIYGNGKKVTSFAFIACDVTKVENESTTNKRLSNIFDRSLNEIYVFDEETLQFTDVNNGALLNIGYTIDEMSQMTPLDIKPTMTIESFNKLIEPLRNKEVPKIEFETIHKRKDESTYDVEVHLQLFEYPNEKVFVAIILDITSRNKTKAKLQRSEAFLKKSQTVAKLGSWELDIENRGTFYSDEFKRLNGFGNSEHPDYKELLNKIHPEDMNMARETINQAILSKNSFSIQYRIQSENDEYIWVTSTGEFYHDDISNSYKLVGTYQDITELKNHESEIADLNQKLGLALGSAAIGIWERDFENDIFVWDSNMYKIYGVDHRSFMPTPFSWKKFVAPEDNNVIEEFKKSVYNSDTDYFECTYKIIKPDDSVAYIRSSSYIVRNSSNSPIKAIGLDIDITDLKDAELEAHKANRAKSDFLAQMTHELRTPLNGIIGYAEMLQQEELSAKAQKYSKIINDSGSYLLKLINEILDLSKIESGKMNLVITKANIREIANEAIQSVRYLSENSDVELMISISPTVREFINTDQDKLVQVLVNLLANALKFTHEGFVRLTVRKIEKNNSSKVRFLVEDTGVGISKDVQSNIFTKFTQIESSSLQKGTGLGLNIADSFVDALGGKLQFNSIEGEGSNFFFDLDPEFFNSESVMQNKSILDSRETNYALTQSDIADGISVLVVEDNAVNMLLTTSLLRNAIPDITIFEAVDGSEAVSMFMQNKPTFILMDLRMPKMNGIEASNTIRSLPGGDKLPIIALTASALKDRKEETERANMNDFLTKPITKASMESFLERLFPFMEFSNKVVPQDQQHDLYEYSEESLLKSLDGDRELLKSLMQSAKSYLLEIPVGIEFALIKNEKDKVKELAHKLAGMSSNIGFKQLSDVAKYIELNCDRSLKELREEINALRKSTDYYLDLIENKYSE